MSLMRHCVLAGKHQLARSVPLTPVFDSRPGLLAKHAWRPATAALFIQVSPHRLQRVRFYIHFAQRTAGLKYLCDSDRKLSDGPCSRAPALQVVFRVMSQNSVWVSSFMCLTHSTAHGRHVANTGASCWTIASSHLMAIVPIGLKVEYSVHYKGSHPCAHTHNGWFKQALPHSGLGTTNLSQNSEIMQRSREIKVEPRRFINSRCRAKTSCCPRTCPKKWLRDTK